MPNNIVPQGKEKLFELKGNKSSDNFPKSFVNLPKGVFSASTSKDLGFKITAKDEHNPSHQSKGFYGRSENLSAAHLANFSHAIRETSTKDVRVASPFSSQRHVKSSIRNTPKTDPAFTEGQKAAPNLSVKNSVSESDTNEDASVKEALASRSYQPFTKPLFRTKIRDEPHQENYGSESIDKDTTKTVSHPSENVTASHSLQKQLRLGIMQSNS
ncbi:hypothetical protein K493DRAFT_307167 [Basidiobolus meristosporus CBS 931.73]|uniref:Uncharacterized protein n=1 Tax=Basidiobolus meristosporus CBS 931.73 TaxID=1314790 RepID=A0A1Y1XJS1_9FUNG|nr:hypothetical protein K493DRAFT_307167 [Basidiobolus meristosporus CBS 931.73]|eukprot:ORX85953.1 hypothetical protein K493DRAFT_307167 [Basidiobolus meristosporus CBS 931.73]